MPFLLLLLLTLACLPVAWPRLAGLSDTGSVGLTALAMGSMVAAAWLLSRLTARQLRRHPELREPILHHYGRLRLLHLIALVCLYGLSVGLFGWGWLVQHLGNSYGPEELLATEQILLGLWIETPRTYPLTEGVYLGAELVILAPFFAALVLSWACFYNVERALHDTAGPLAALHPFWGRWSYVGFHVRQNLALILPPLLLLVTTQGLLRRYQDLHSDLRFQAAAYGLLFGLLVCMPWVLRLVLGLRPLPEGPIRTRLMQTAQRLRFRCSNILLWPTRGGVANAMVVGVLPSLRYVVLTDRLVSDLALEEVEAVFGHEVGHVKHHHILFYLGFLLVSLAVVAGAWTLLVAHTSGDLRGPSPTVAAGERGDSLTDLGSDSAGDNWSMLPLVPVFGAYVFVVFGFLSRRCERQADIYGCRAVSCGRPDCSGHEPGTVLLSDGSSLCPSGIQTFILALEKVARLNGISRSKPGWLNSWQHSTIARRVEFLQRLLHDPGLERRFQRRVALVKWSLLLILSSLLVLIGSTQGWRELRPF
jgi:Zn-dependent protease with chaperone function